jgi:uncharacterized membrane protein (DUF485 family)
MSVGVSRHFRWLWTPLKPRVVLALLVSASLAGRWLTAETQSTGLFGLLNGWFVLLGVAVVVAAVGWRLTLFRWFGPAGPAAAFANRRFGLLALAGAGTLVVGTGSAAVLDPTTASVIRPLAGLLAAGGIIAGTQYGSRIGYVAAVISGVVVLAVTSVQHVYGGAGVQAAVRFAHLGAVVVWFGGALWHNVVLAPAIQRYPDAKPAFTEQAKRFRPVVFASIAVVFLTGLYQSHALLGVNARQYLTTPLGNAILLKSVVICVLAVFVALSILRQ